MTAVQLNSGMSNSFSFKDTAAQVGLLQPGAALELGRGRAVRCRT